MRAATAGGLLIVAALAPLSPGRARACSLAGPTPHAIDPTMVGVDQTPPNLPQPTVVKINRHDGTGCRGGDSCGDFVSVEITNLATDDLTPADKIGYRFTVVAGSGFTPPSGAVRTGNAGDTFWLFLDGYPDDVDFTLQMVAIDAAGNESAPQTVRVQDDTGACSVGRNDRGGVLALAIVALALAVARRQRGRRGATGALAIFVAVAAVVSPSRARACEPLGTSPHTTDPGMVGIDQTPPILAQPVVGDINRGDGEGCISSSKCRAPGIVGLSNLASDDMTAAADIGYRFTVMAGAAPPGLWQPGKPVRGNGQGFSLSWDGGYQDDIDFTIELVAVDKAGNESAPRIVRIQEDTGGCSVGRRHPAMLTIAVVMLALATAATRRLRRRRT
jgi:MYXO-CTERM domain-containing protein